MLQWVKLPSFFVLSLRLELFPEGPLQLRDRQRQGEGAVRLWPDDPGFKRTLEQDYDTNTLAASFIKNIKNKIKIKTHRQPASISNLNAFPFRRPFLGFDHTEEKKKKLKSKYDIIN